MLLMLCGADHEVPFQETALPPKSTAMQKDVVGQDTEKTGMLPLMFSPVDQEVPFHMAASEPTAIQNDGDTHDTETTGTLMACGDDQEDPFQVMKSPD